MIKGNVKKKLPRFFKVKIKAYLLVNLYQKLSIFLIPRTRTKKLIPKGSRYTNALFIYYDKKIFQYNLTFLSICFYWVTR